VARRAKIAPTVISQIEHGKYHPSHDTVERIANAIELSDVHTQALLDARDKIADVK
jgi:transcriptional regulator with XRE-family HTH domain